MTIALRAAAFACAVAAILGLLQWWGVGLKLLFAAAVLIGFVAWAFPRLGVRWLDALVLLVRSRFWAREQGRFHSFSGVSLRIEDDGRHVWVEGDGFQRAMGGRRDADDVLAARLSGAWRRDREGALLLRVDAVVQYLDTMPGRADPRVQRLRRYFERDVLYPAAQRRQRSTPSR